MSHVQDGVSKPEWNLNEATCKEELPNISCVLSDTRNRSDDKISEHHGLIDKDEISNTDTELCPEYYSFGLEQLPTAHIPREDLLVAGHGGDTTRADIEPEPDIWYDVSSGFDRYSSYAPIIRHSKLPVYNDKSYTFHANMLGSQLNIPGWLYELRFENDMRLRNYISFGIQEGFLIVDDDKEIPAYECKNYLSD